MATMDQVAWAGANVLVGDARENYTRGALLPEPVTPDEAYDRQTLRLIGAVRVVEVVYTPDELAAQMQLQGEATAQREAAGQVDPGAPLGQQVEQRAEAGPPTVVGPGGAPVVIGDEDLKAEHDKQARAAEKRGAAADKEAKAAAEQEAAAEPEAEAKTEAHPRATRHR